MDSTGKPALNQTRTVRVVRLLLFLAALIILSLTPRLVEAQPSPPSTPIPTEIPAVATLESKLATQQVDISSLQYNLSVEQRDREYYVRDLQWKWGIAAAIGTAVIALLTWTGLNELKKLQEKWQTKSEKILNKAIYKLDIAKLPIYLPANENLENVHQLLKRRKFEAVEFYEDGYEEIKQGVILLSLKDKDDQQQKALLAKYGEYLQGKKPDPAKIGFILYAPGGIRVPPQYMDCYENQVTANYLSTVVSNVFTIGRGIDITPPQNFITEGK